MERLRLADYGDTMSVEDAGRVLGISRGAAYAAARTGEIPTIRIGKRLIVPTQALAALLAGDPPVPPSIPSAWRGVGGIVRARRSPHPTAYGLECVAPGVMRAPIVHDGRL